MLPASIQKARLGLPAHGEGRAAVQHPRPIDALVDFCGEVLDFLIGEILASGKDAAKKQGSVDRGQLAFLPALASLHVDEVVEETVFVLEVVREKTQRVADALANLRGLSETSAIANT